MAEGCQEARRHPLPIGKEATVRLQAQLEEHELQANSAELETQGCT